MRIKKNGKVINLTESDIKKLNKSLLKEQVSTFNTLYDVIDEWSNKNGIQFDRRELMDCDCFNNIFK